MMRNLHADCDHDRVGLDFDPHKYYLRSCHTCKMHVCGAPDLAFLFHNMSITIEQVFSFRGHDSIFPTAP